MVAWISWCNVISIKNITARLLDKLIDVSYTLIRGIKWWWVFNRSTIFLKCVPHSIFSTISCALLSKLVSTGATRSDWAHIKSASSVIIQISTTEEKSLRKKFICLASWEDETDLISTQIRKRLTIWPISFLTSMEHLGKNEHSQNNLLIQLDHWLQ